MGLRTVVATAGAAAFAFGAAAGVSGRDAEQPPQQRERARWGAQIDALMTAKLAEVALARQIARTAHRAALRREAARMQLESQQALMQLDTAYRRQSDTPWVVSGKHPSVLVPAPGRGRRGLRWPATNDEGRLTALIAARRRAVVLAGDATGHPALPGRVLDRVARADRAAVVRLAGWRVRWFG